MLSKNSLSRVLPLILLVVVFFAIHVPKLGTEEINPDAVNWHWRSEQFIDALKSKDFMRTYQIYHPGVTLMIITGAPVELTKRIITPRLEYSRTSYELFNFIAKYSLNVVLLMLIMLAVFELSTIYGFKIAYLTGAFLTLEPFFVGNFRMLHMDALLTMLIFTALLSLYLAVKRQSWVYGVIASILIGLACWTKIVALMAVLYALGFIVLMFTVKKLTVKKTLMFGFSIILGVVAVGLLIFPAMWVNPSKVVKKMYNDSRTVVESGHEEVFMGQITQDPGPLYYPISLAYKLSPLTLGLFAMGLVLLLRSVVLYRVKILKTDKMLLVYLLGFFIVYFTAIELSQKKIDRYLLPLFPVIFVFTSYYLMKIFHFTKNPHLQKGIWFIVALNFAIPLITYFPYYFVYNNPLFGGTRTAAWAVGQKSFGVGVFEVRDFIHDNYPGAKVGMWDRKPLAAIYPGSSVLDVRVYGFSKYDILVLDNDDQIPPKAKDAFVLDKSLNIGGIKLWNFYVKKTK